MRIFIKPVRFLIWIILFCLTSIAIANEPLYLVSTTTTRDSGLFDGLLSAFTEHSNIQVKPVYVSTGQALAYARRGDADVIVVHHTPSELELISQGFATQRHDLMFNDFVLIGPKQDPAGIKGSASVDQAMQLIADGMAQQQASFISRADESGTHIKERQLWQLISVNEPQKQKNYFEAGVGMGQTLNIAVAKQSYVLSDRGTWLNFKNKGELELLYGGGDRLKNQYGVVLLNPDKLAHINAQSGKIFYDWILSKPAQTLINEYAINGEQAFFANANAP